MITNGRFVEALLKLARIGAEHEHNRGTERDGHGFPYKFETCSHQDCAMFREVERLREALSPPQELEAHNVEIRIGTPRLPQATASTIEGQGSRAITGSITKRVISTTQEMLGREAEPAAGMTHYTNHRTLKLTVRDALLMYGRHLRGCALDRGVGTCNCSYGTACAEYAMPNPHENRVYELEAESAALIAQLRELRGQFADCVFGKYPPSFATIAIWLKRLDALLPPARHPADQ